MGDIQKDSKQLKSQQELGFLRSSKPKSHRKPPLITTQCWRHLLLRTPTELLASFIPFSLEEAQIHKKMEYLTDSVILEGDMEEAGWFAEAG